MSARRGTSRGRQPEGDMIMSAERQRDDAAGPLYVSKEPRDGHSIGSGYTIYCRGWRPLTPSVRASNGNRIRRQAGIRHS